jgi:hypothetical protein
MIGLGAALAGHSGLATAGPKFVIGRGHRLSVPGITALPLDSHVHLLVVRIAGTFV